MAKSKKQSAKLSGLEAIYAAFLAKLSSSERETIEDLGVAQAMPAFRKFLNSLTEEEMTSMVEGEVEDSEDEEVEE